MIRLFTVAFLLSFSTVLSQKLHFDVLAKYSIQYKDDPFEISTYAISSNNNYFMRVLNNHDGHQTAEIYDIKGLIKHYYKIVDSKSESGEIITEFKYTGSRSVLRSQKEITHFDFQSISTKDDMETVIMTLYNNKAKTKVENTMELKIIKSEVNFFPLFRFICLHGYSLESELNYPKAGLVTSGIAKKGYGRYTLKAFEEADLEVMLPNNASLIK